MSSDKKSYQTYYPFGPSIGVAKMSEEMVNDLNTACDTIVDDKKLSEEFDYSESLVGEVEQEIEIPKELIVHWASWFNTQVKNYAKDNIDQLYFNSQMIPHKYSYENSMKLLEDIKIGVTGAWFVRSFAGDFNPLHVHTHCHLTCVGFLKVPDWSKEPRKMHHSGEPRPLSNGTLEILGNNGMHIWENNRMRIVPAVGDWYLFPGDLHHSVYPFDGDEERRSFSMNFETSLGMIPT